MPCGFPVQEVAGATAAELIIQNAAECTVDNILDHLSTSECRRFLGIFAGIALLLAQRAHLWIVYA